MRSFTTADLNKQVGEVTDAAQRAPVVITRRSNKAHGLVELGEASYCYANTSSKRRTHRHTCRAQELH